LSLVLFRLLWMLHRFACIHCCTTDDCVNDVDGEGGLMVHRSRMLLCAELIQHARQGNAKGVEAALTRGAIPDTRKPLMVVKEDWQAESLETFAKDRADWLDGMTPLMFASQCGSLSCVELLLHAAALVDAREEDGWSALHFAAKGGHLDVCLALLQSRADPMAVNEDSKTPLQMAEAEGDLVFSNALREASEKEIDSQQHSSQDVRDDLGGMLRVVEVKLIREI